MFTDCSHDSIEIEKNILKQIPHDLKIFQCKTEEEVIEHCHSADALISQFAPLTKKVMDNLKNCKVIARYGIGVDGIDLKSATENGIIITNSGEYCTDEVATHTIALILSFARGIVQYNDMIKTKKIWNFQSMPHLTRLNKLTLGLFGYGKIAREVAKRAICMGFSVIAHDPYVKESKDDMVKLVDFQTLLKESDYLSLHTPLIPETRHRFAKNELEAMKKTSVIINVARGGVINEDDLFNALKNGTIAGAALDVLEKEPPNDDNSLLKLDNVIVTPHAAFFTKESYQYYKEITAQAIVDVLNGKIPGTIVNKELTRIRDV